MFKESNICSEIARKTKPKSNIRNCEPDHRCGAVMEIKWTFGISYMLSFGHIHTFFFIRYVSFRFPSTCIYLCASFYFSVFGKERERKMRKKCTEILARDFATLWRQIHLTCFYTRIPNTVAIYLYQVIVWKTK